MNFIDKTLEGLFKNLFAQADIQINGSRPWDIQIHNPKFYRRLFLHHSLGLGESYVDGFWDSRELDQFLTKLFSSKLLDWFLTGMWFFTTIRKLFNFQSIRRSKQVAEKHYDLGNDFYQLMLDKNMQYSCAYWKNADNLEEAQIAKMDLICRKLKLKKGETLLDIGCGWGGLAKYASEKYGVIVTGINISEEQIKFAKEFCKGLPVTILNVDYRNFTGKFDKIVSVGMFEHVGPKNYRKFMQKANDLLNDNGLFLLHSIGASDSRLSSEPWLEKYIFPNGTLPSIRNVGSSIDGKFVLQDVQNLGKNYEYTLKSWFERFENNFKLIQGEKFDERFYRMWKLYLIYTRCAFKTEISQLWQFVLSKRTFGSYYESER